ncbi:class F sortase [Streptomyces sp. CC208A]|uniref:class F sortase n=1 Tax=Streptomyces sp. CC208A TaxID=3044573 RepID=UPI0024A8406F|nr:class F sortase [Streptomyces sp. CC208A]
MDSAYGRRGAWGTVVVLLLVGVHLVRGGTQQLTAPGPPQPLAAEAPAPAATPLPAPPGLPASPPLAVTIPALGVDAPLTRVGLDAEGWLEAPPPEHPGRAGWYAGAVTPGEPGTAVVVGHVDTPAGPAVFHSLGALTRGRTVEVHRADGRTAVFTVHGVELVPKDAFPAARVYASTGAPELRVITCGGPYTPATGYTGNIIVSARLTAVR